MLQSTVPVRAPVKNRQPSLSRPAQQAQARKEALVRDPLLALRDCQSLLGNPSYPVLKKWIKDGSLRVWRVGNSHYRTRLSWIEEFIASGNKTNAEK
jgi:hypothetical protein